jgi:hypothetical protein
MAKPRILLEISGDGITETGIIAKTDEEQTAAHRLLATVASQLRSLSAALKLAGLENSK